MDQQHSQMRSARQTTQHTSTLDWNSRCMGGCLIDWIMQNERCVGHRSLRLFGTHLMVQDG